MGVISVGGVAGSDCLYLRQDCCEVQPVRWEGWEQGSGWLLKPARIMPGTIARLCYGDWFATFRLSG